MLKTDFLVDKNDLSRTVFSESPQPVLEEGEVLFEIKRYAFTSNNITYAVVGDLVKYWDFFPVEAPYGIVPVWGYATVTASNHPAVTVGEEYYGYFPMSSHLKVRPGHVKPHGFFDSSPHRAHLAAVYNHYSRTAADPGFQQNKADLIPIFKPLFATAFLLYHFLKDHHFFEAENIVLTSASSKTALGLACMLRENKQMDGKKIIALTSGKNALFVKNSGYYDQTILYQQSLEQLPKSNTVLVDFLGNANLLHDVFAQLGDALKHLALVGLTDWRAEKKSQKIPVAHWFFAPTYMQEKYREWGAEKANSLLGVALNGFLSGAENWTELAYITDRASLADMYQSMLSGNVDPTKGYVVRMV